MKWLFSKTGMLALESFCLGQALFAFDYDGTLSPLVINPDNARLPKSTAALLKKLNRLVPLAIITGRSLSQLKALTKFRPEYLVGNHGLEGITPDLQALAKAKQICRKW